MKEIKLTQGKVALVDDEDYSKLINYKWCAHKGGREYWRAERWTSMRNGKRRIVLMSRYIMNSPVNMVVDHIDGNTLDNRKKNLRLCSHSTNMQNIHMERGESEYQGVSWHKKSKKWRAQVAKDKKRYWLGCFDTEKEAAEAYNLAALELYENPRLNVIAI